MSIFIKDDACKTLNRVKGASYYLPKEGKTNPVITSFERDVKLFYAFMQPLQQQQQRQQQREQSQNPTSSTTTTLREPPSKAANALSDLVDKYRSLVPFRLFAERFLEIGKFLVDSERHDLAAWQVYARLISDDVAKAENVQNIFDIESTKDFEAAFFPGGLQSAPEGVVKFKLRALAGFFQAIFDHLRQSDPRLINCSRSVDKSVKLLQLLQFFTQLLLPIEKYYWAVYNGTIAIYNIARMLMTAGFSSKVLPFLLWSIGCVENSVPLMTVDFLEWRGTLYSAACQIYMECREEHHAESLAKRGLTKIGELALLEKMSKDGVEAAKTQQTIRKTCLRLAIVVFKRQVVEARKKPKGMVRPKTRTALKENQQLPWPRTNTEKVLWEMFEGSAAQFLAVLETLNDPTRRILISSPPAVEADIEVLDLYSELFMAAMYIMLGGGGNKTVDPETVGASGAVKDMGGVVAPGEGSRSLIDMAANCEDGVPLKSVIQAVKLAYSYEQWECLDGMLENTLNYINYLKGKKAGGEFVVDEIILKILQAMDRVNPKRKQMRKQNAAAAAAAAQEDGEAPTPAPSVGKGKTTPKKGGGSGKGTPRQGTAVDGDGGGSEAGGGGGAGGNRVGKEKSTGDDLLNLAKVLRELLRHEATMRTKREAEELMRKMDADMVVDSLLFLWNKVKVVFHKYQGGTSAEEIHSYIYKMDSPGRWIFMLETVFLISEWIGLPIIDPTAFAEVSLRYATVVKGLAQMEPRHRETVLNQTRTIRSLASPPENLMSDGSLHLPPDYQYDTAIMSPGPMRVVSGQSSPSPELKGRKGSSNISLDATSLMYLSPTEQIDIAETACDKALNALGRVHQMQTKLDWRNVSPGSVEEANEGEEAEATEGILDMPLDGLRRCEPTALESMHFALYVEILSLQYQLAIIADAARKEKVSSSPTKNDKKSAKVKTKQEPAPEVDISRVICKKNSVAHGLFLMHKSLELGDDLPETEHRRLMQDAHCMLTKASLEEKKLSKWNQSQACLDRQLSNSTVPPAPVILFRNENTIILKPAPWSEKSVGWYRIFAKTFSGANCKVRTQDVNFKGTGEPVYVKSEPLFVVTGLEKNEKYIFAVAAYSESGQMIGASIGKATPPVVAATPIPLILVWCYLAEISFRKNQSPIALKACETIWNHFVLKTTEDGASETSGEIFTLSLHNLNLGILKKSSPILLRQFINNIFIHINILSKDFDVPCNQLVPMTRKTPVIETQMLRLQGCERLLVAMELSGILNDPSLLLMAVTYTYGLLAPLLAQKVQTLSIAQILQQCIAAIQAIPQGLIHPPKKGNQNSNNLTMADNIQHMVATATYHLANIMKNCYGQKSLVAAIYESGRNMLTPAEAKESGGKPGEGGKPPGAPEAKGPAADKGGAAAAGGAGSTEPPTQLEVEALLCAEEVPTILSGIKMAQSKRRKKKAENSEPVKPGKELTNLNEELKTLEGHLFRLSRNILKFKRRAKYLEFFIHVVEKALAENAAEVALDWCEDSLLWLAKTHQYEEMSQSDAKGKDEGKKPPAKKAKFKPTAGGPGGGEDLEEAQRQAAAMETLTQYFPEIFYAMVERRKKRKIFLEEVPLKAQLYALQGLSYFLLFHQKMEFRDKLSENSNKIFAISQLDNEWFSYPVCGTVVFGLTSKSEKAKKAQTDQHSLTAAGPSNLSAALGGVSGRNRSRALERAAAMATTGRASQAKDLERPPSGQTRGTTSPTREQTAQSQGGLSHREALELVSKMLDSFSRAMVLAHRGSHWILLQNTIISMTNSIVSILNCAGGILIDKEKIQHLLCPAYRKAADCLLDMLVKLDDGFVPSKIPRNNQSILPLSPMQIEWMGDVKKDFGGSGLKFDKSFDDQSQIDKRLIKDVVFETIELLFKEGRFEFLSDIALRFNAISNGMFAHLIDPFLILSQRRLIEKVERNGGPKPTQPYFEAVEKELGKPITDLKYLNLQYRVFINPAQITKKSKGDANQPKIQIDGTKVVCVPLNLNESLLSLRNFVQNINYASLALQHARKLLQLYLSRTTAKCIEDLKKEAQERALKKQMSSIAEDTGGAEGKLVSGIKKEESTTRRSSKAGSVKTVTRQSTVKETDKKGSLKGMEADAKKKLGGKASEEEEAFKLEYDFEKIHSVSSIPMNPNIIDFSSTNDVLSLSLTHDSLNIVIDAYDKAIQMLKAKGQEDLVVEGLHELANLYHYIKKPKLAYQLWAEALDLCCKHNDIIQQWNEIWNQDEDVPMQILKKCGIWGSLLSGVLVVKIAKYIARGNGSKQRELCLIASKFFKAALRSSLMHPVSDLMYATYDIGIGASGASDLLAGIDILGDRFRLDARLIVGSLSWLSNELVKNKNLLVSLPILTLQSHFASHYSRDVGECVESRILKVRALSDSDLPSEAFFNLQLLLNGFRLPQQCGAVWRVSENNPVSLEFKNNLSILDLQNLKFLDYIMEKRMSPILTALYGPQLTCKILIAHAHALISLADTLNVFPVYEDIMSQMQETGESARETPTLKPPAPPVQDKSGTKVAVVQEETASEAGSETQLVNNPLSSGFKPVTFDLIKGYLLHTAESLVDGMFQAFSETIHTLATKNTSNDEEIAKVQLPSLTVAELETLILCLQEMAAISLQHQHANRAARCIFMAMDQTAKNKIFTCDVDNLIVEDIEPPSPGEVKSCSHIDNKLWVQLRLSLVQCLESELKNFHGNEMENGSVTTNQVSIIGDAKTHCTIGIEEAEEVGDRELKASFLFLAAQLALKEGQAVNQVQIGLNHCLSTLREIADDQMSALGTSLLPKALILSTDLANSENVTNNQHSTLSQYREAQNILLTKLCLQGEQLEEHPENLDLNHLKSPLQNVHSKLLPILIDTKLRISNIICASINSNIANNDSSAQDLAICYSIFATSHNMNRVITSRQSNSEIQLEGLLGITKGVLALQGHYGSIAGATSHLLRAITMASQLDHNISFIRKMYLELALLFHCSSETQVLAPPHMATPSVSMEDQNDGEADPPVRSISPKKSMLRLKAREKGAASVALRLATAAGIAQQERIKLFGKCKSDNFKRWNAQAQINIPEFIIVDLLSPILFDSKKNLNSSLEEEIALCDAEASAREESTLVYKNDHEEPDAARRAITKQLVKEEVREDKEEEEGAESVISEVVVEKDPEFQISWIQILSYQSVLQRLSSLSLATQKRIETKNPDALAFLRKTSSVSSFRPSGTAPPRELSWQELLHPHRDQIVDTPVNTSSWHIRLRIIHKFMVHNLPDYASSCLAPMPTKEFYFKVASENLFVARNSSIAKMVKNYDENLRLYDGEDDGGGSGGGRIDGGSKAVRLENPIPGVVGTTAEAPSPGGSVAAIGEPGSGSGGTLGVPTTSLPASPGNELFLQWYKPQLANFYDRHAKTRRKTSSNIEENDRTFLLFTMTTKTTKESSSSSSVASAASSSSLKVKNGLTPVSLSGLRSLHRHVVTAAHQLETVTLERQNAESLLSSKDSLQVPPATGKKKKGTKLHAKTGPTPLQRMEADLAQQLKRVVVETHALLDASLPETAVTAPKSSPSPGPGDGAADASANAGAATPGAADSTEDLSLSSSTALKGAEDLPFAPTIANIQLLEKIFDPQLGGSVGDAGANADVFKWITDLLLAPTTSAGKT